ncbi:3-deoxy-7-phosphoheptulonate synthase [Streptomyces sp. NBC_00654]|uniref:3-deoxy-7-phosphoheptulonate synthase n=1 Tax=Streptomyces sp. NBC_00654 TaxID=2975799 RepID=UPI002B1E3DB2|nr:3-deoxy-7-phosphoheptulonate synthase [Streptomyces sp. NBC_00654]
MAGQFAKPRSQTYEYGVGGRVPVYRGPMVNGPEPTHRARRADPGRMIGGYRAAREILRSLDALGRGDGATFLDRVWASHEALLLDYETPLVRPTGGGGRYLASTHWPGSASAPGRQTARTCGCWHGSRIPWRARWARARPSRR